MKMKRVLVSIVGAAVAALAISASAAAAGNDVRKAGTCSRASTSKIKVKPDDGRLQVEFEVDQNKNGVRWDVKFKDNSRVVFVGSATTRAPSGSFSIERRIADQSGSDTVVGIGTNPTSGERCTARVTI